MCVLRMEEKGPSKRAGATNTPIRTPTTFTKTSSSVTIYKTGQDFDKA